MALSGKKIIHAPTPIADEKPEGAIFVVPLRLDDCLIPRRVKNRQYADYFETSDKDRNYLRVLESLNFRELQVDDRQAELPSTSAPSIFTGAEHFPVKFKKKEDKALFEGHWELP